MIKVFVTKTTQNGRWVENPKEKIFPFESLEDCLTSLEKRTGIGMFVVSPADPELEVKEKYDWIVEIYDDWRE